MRPTALPEVTVSESSGVRYLHLGTPWIQGAMRLEAPLAIELEYVQRMMAWMLFRDEAEVTHGHAVQLGLGAAAITRFCVGRLRMRTTAVELNPRVVEVCRRWFRLPADSQRLQVRIGDAGAFAADPQRRGTVDALMVDLYDHEAAAPVLDSADFYRDCHGLLAAGGVMTVNLFGRDASCELSMERIAAAFGADSVLRLRPTREGNTVAIAMKQVTPAGLDLLARRAENIETRWKLPARKWLRMMHAFSAAMPPPLPDLPPA
ncbi:MAG: spermidine synthase [Caldimonas sp.]